jgi:hypothetical protein
MSRYDRDESPNEIRGSSVHGPAEGVKVTVTLQLAPTARELPQLFVCAKSPLAVIEATFSTTVCPFFTVIVFPALVVETTWLPNERLVGERVTD